MSKVLDNRTWEIYSLSDPRTEEVRYVGVTHNRVKRINAHINSSKKGKTHCQKWIRKLLSMNLKPLYSVIEIGTGTAWKDREKFWISEYRKICNLTNLTDGGDGVLGYKPTKEQRLKLSIRATGKSLSEEAKNRISEFMKNRSVSIETRQRISSSLTGRKLTEEHVKHMADAKRGSKCKPCSIERKLKISMKNKGRKLSKQSIEKMVKGHEKMVKCIETGKIYDSILKAAKANGVSSTSIWKSIKKGYACKGNHYKKLES